MKDFQLQKQSGNRKKKDYKSDFTKNTIGNLFEEKHIRTFSFLKRAAYCLS